MVAVDIDQTELDQLHELTNEANNNEAVNVVLRSYITTRTPQLVNFPAQTAAVERIIARQFTEEQINATVIDYPDELSA